MPDALNIAQARGAWLHRSLPRWCWLALMLSLPGALAQERRISFDIPAQPLENALVEFADKTGMAALVDGELTHGLQSSLVMGRLLPIDALRVLLAGTGFSGRFVGGNAFTISATVTEPAGAAASVQNGRRIDHGVYFSQLQSAIERDLCRDDETRPGRYRVAIQLWIGNEGNVQAVHFLGSTGDVSRDAAITTVLSKTGVAVPPPDLPQPVTVILTLKPPVQAESCVNQPGLPQ